MNLQFQKPDKKSLYYLIIILAISLLVCIGLLYYLAFVLRPEPIMELPGKTLAEQQIEQIDRLMKNMKPPSAEEVKKQQQEIQKQFEELNKLR